MLRGGCDHYGVRVFVVDRYGVEEFSTEFGEQANGRDALADTPPAPTCPAQLCNSDESGHSFRTNPDTENGPIRTGGRLKADTPK